MTNHQQNNQTEKEGVALLKRDFPNLLVPTGAEKKVLLERVGCSIKLQKAFDAILLNVPTVNDIKSVADFTFIEIKSSAKGNLVNFPKGYWFGLTENERSLGKIFGQKYLFCFVNVHPDIQRYELLTLAQVDKRISNKNIVEHISF